jgi:hypothetical protein
MRGIYIELRSFLNKPGKKIKLSGTGLKNKLNTNQLSLLWY